VIASCFCSQVAFKFLVSCIALYHSQRKSTAFIVAIRCKLSQTVLTASNAQVA